MRTVIAASVILFAASSAHAQSPAPSSAPSSDAATASAPAAPPQAGRGSASTGDPNRKVCRAKLATGSRLSSTKTCKTAAEWEAQRHETRMDVERAQRTMNTRAE